MRCYRHLRRADLAGFAVLVAAMLLFTGAAAAAVLLATRHLA